MILPSQENVSFKNKKKNYAKKNSEQITGWFNKRKIKHTKFALLEIFKNLK